MNTEVAAAAAPQAVDASALVQHLKSQFFSGEKALSKNQRKRARKKVAKRLHEALGVVRPDKVDGASGDHVATGQPAQSEDTGCSNRKVANRETDPPACTSLPPPSHRRQNQPEPRPQPKRRRVILTSSPPPPPGGTQRPGAEEPRTSQGKPPQSSRLPSHCASLKGPEPGQDTAAAVAAGPSGGSPKAPASRRKRAAAAAAAGDASLSYEVTPAGAALSGGSSHLSRGAQKRLVVRQPLPEDLLTADDGRAEDGSGAAPPGSKAHGGTTEACGRSRRQRQESRGQSGKRTGRAGGTGPESSVVAAASEEVVQVPRAAGGAATAAAAVAAAAAAAVHRGYTAYRSAVATAVAAPTLPLSAMPAGAAAGGVMGAVGAAPPLLGAPWRPAGATGAAPVDLSAALLMMRVQLRTAAAASGGAAGEASVETFSSGDGTRGTVDTATAGGKGGGGGGDVEIDAAAAAVVAMATLTQPAGGGAAAAPGAAGLKASPGQKQQQQKQQGMTVEKAALHRYGNYHRYYGYRLGPDLDEDPRVKLMRREWFQNKVCVDVGCNEGLVTLAVAARFGAKRMTGYDIDPALIKRACSNLRIMRSEYTTRLQAVTLGGGGGDGGAAETFDGSGDEDPTAKGADLTGAAGGAPDSAPGAAGAVGVGGAGASGAKAAQGVAAEEKEARCRDDDDEEEEDEDAEEKEEGSGDTSSSSGDGDSDSDEGDDSSTSDDSESDDDSSESGGADGAARLATPAGASTGAAAAGAGRAAAAGLGSDGGTAQEPKPAAGKKVARAKGPYRASGPPPPPRIGLLRSYVRSLAGTFFVIQDWVNARGRPESADAILCLSLTKWVHLNHGDEGLKKLFRKFFDTLTPGGLLVLEPQPWKSYKRAIQKTTTHAVPFRRIEQLQLRPESFGDYLTSQVGFTLEARLNEGAGGGFDRPMYLFRKP